MSRFVIIYTSLSAVAAVLRVFLRRVHRTLYGVRTTLAFIAVILVTFLATSQAEELALTRAESPLALIRMLIAVIWFSATIWHCSDAKFRSSPILLAGRLAAFRRSAVPALLAVGFVGVMAISEVRAMQMAAALPRDPIRMYPILEMQSLGILMIPTALRSVKTRTRRHLSCVGQAFVRALRSRLLFVVISLALFAWAFSAPVGFAWTVGPEGTLLFAASCWLTAITYAQLYWRREWVAIPLVLIGLATVVSLWTDSHSIRCTECGEQSYPQVHAMSAKNSEDDDRKVSLRGPAPLTNKLYAYEFLNQLDERQPIVLVSAAGGGLRAAYWTATILGDLQDRFPSFDRHTFMISGVSGGSLGAGVYRALLHHARLGKPVACRNRARDAVTGYRLCGQAILDHDFTGPVLAALLFRDLLPLPWVPDRSAVLEKAWEAAWRNTMLDPGEGLSRRFDRIDATSRFPVLVLNGVSALTGQRILAAGLTENEQLLNVAKVRPLPLSAAIGISTRFPFIEPAGSVYDRVGHFYDAVVDGGYVENFGSNSALEVLREIGNLIQDDREPHPRGTRQFIRTAVFVQVSSDPTLDDGSNLLFSNGLSSISVLPISPIGSPGRVRNLEQVWVPFFALLRGQSTQSTFTASLVSTYVASMNGVFSHFRLADRYAHAPVLGWTLSKRSQLQIDGERIQMGSRIITHLQRLLSSP
ncbi:patatin-like phospholipase family protein [Bradyrhizobium zhanjiangense]|uniref:patatin-like phospholipase family protein n=1 Tax=Bradyrhizobium zhanjiangense TaxID=1325107 RepID=UPI0010093431|nr:patatin-like phospholipase family protein [Bradyrhizobium zhanjiangense]